MNTHIYYFNDYPINYAKGYAGANGSKVNVKIDGISYMLKTAGKKKHKQVTSYSNSCFSEYIACHILQTLGLNTQETILGFNKLDTHEIKEIVGCKDFEDASDKRLMNFSLVINQTLYNHDEFVEQKELSTILDIIDRQLLVHKNKLKDFFWEMFIADALIGNFDRNSSNWGILVNQDATDNDIAPIYDCGSSLYPKANEEEMKTILSNIDEIDRRVYDFPTSYFQIDGKKINYFDYISSLQNEDCNKALIKIGQRIDLANINEIIEQTPIISEIHKDFLKRMIKARKEKIIDFSLDKLEKRY